VNLIELFRVYELRCESEINPIGHMHCAEQEGVHQKPRRLALV